jgi:hypothetical protein
MEENNIVIGYDEFKQLVKDQARLYALINVILEVAQPLKTGGLFVTTSDMGVIMQTLAPEEYKTAIEGRGTNV